MIELQTDRPLLLQSLLVSPNRRVMCRGERAYIMELDIKLHMQDILPNEMLRTCTIIYDYSQMFTKFYSFFPHQVQNSTECSGGNGTYACGICSCNPDRYGTLCECSNYDISGSEKRKACSARYSDDRTICICFRSNAEFCFKHAVQGPLSCQSRSAG